VIDVPITIGADDARRAAMRELSKRIYHTEDKPWLQRVLEAVVHWLGHVLDRTAGASPGGATGLVLIAVALVLIVIALRLGLGPLARAGRVSHQVFEASELDAAGHVRAADAFAARGDYAAAVTERFRAIVRRLEERGVLEPRAGRTADEAAAEAGRILVAVDAELRAAARAFDDVLYGGRPATEATDQMLRGLYGDVSTTRIPIPA
jgi:hypothetical protein